MEVHPPTKPIESVKDFLLHLLTITIGILIALGLEQSVESWHRHHLAEQARENILSEIRDNKSQLDRHRQGTAKDRKILSESLDVARQLIAGKKMESLSMQVVSSGATLSSTSWVTASSTGALAFMGYEDIKRFAGVYEVQAVVQRQQDDNLRATSTALASMSVLERGAEKVTPDQLKEIEHNLLTCLAGLTMWDQMARQLSEEYGKALGK